MEGESGQSQQSDIHCGPHIIKVWFETLSVHHMSLISVPGMINMRNMLVNRCHIRDWQIIIRHDNQLNIQWMDSKQLYEVHLLYIVLWSC